MHLPVLLQELTTGLSLTPNQHCLDGTVGAGGHAAELLRHTAPDGLLIGCDRDQESLHQAKKTLQKFGQRFLPVHDSYANILKHKDLLSVARPLHAIVLDLGLSSIQLDDPKRGFAFRFRGPLDMRFDQRQQMTAADILNSQSEEELGKIFREYGEESQQKKLAAAIVAMRQRRPFRETTDLFELVEAVLGRGHRRVHPATRIFQALRIAVNDELAHLRRFLPIAVDLLAHTGRFAVISFHSLEDRIVKQFFQQESTDCLCPPEIPICRCGHRATIKRITKKPITPTEQEIITNPRSRSAKLRIIEKLPSPH